MSIQRFLVSKLVILPILLIHNYTKNTDEFINNIGETKRFMAYEIVKRLKVFERTDLLNLMNNTVTTNEIRI